MLLFISITGENILAELIKDVLKPLAASLITLLPVGAVFGLVFYGERAEGYMVGILGVLAGMFAGLLAGFAASGVYLLMGAPVSDAFSWWWILIGTGYSFVFISRLRSSALAPILGLAIALVFFFAASALPLEVYARNTFQRSGAAVMYMLADAAGGMLTAPEVPAHFWYDAERNISTGGSRDIKEGQGENVRAESWLGGRLARLASCGAPQSPSTTPIPKQYEERNMKFCEQLLLGWRSGLARSWVVIAFFSFGLGASKLLDDRLRPEDYGGSSMRRLDRVIAVVAVMLVIATSLLIRFLL
jgi:hypothetical protein